MQQKSDKSKTSTASVSLRSEHDGQSIGAIVSDLSWKTNESLLGPIELIPAFESEELVPIRQSLGETKSTNCSAYEKLRPIQKQWLDVYTKTGMISSDGSVPADFISAKPSKFEKSAYKTIALEIREYDDFYRRKIVDLNSIDQLICVLNFASIQGGRRIILINQTTFSSEELLIKIKAQLPESEREETLSRLELLLCETENSIFSYDEFNGLIENAPLNGLNEDSLSMSWKNYTTGNGLGIFARRNEMQTRRPCSLFSTLLKPT